MRWIGPIGLKIILNKKDLQRDCQRCTAYTVPFHTVLVWGGGEFQSGGGISLSGAKSSARSVGGYGFPLSSPRSGGGGGLPLGPW